MPISNRDRDLSGTQSFSVAQLQELQERQQERQRQDESLANYRAIYPQEYGPGMTVRPTINDVSMDWGAFGTQAQVLYAVDAETPAEPDKLPFVWPKDVQQQAFNISLQEKVFSYFKGECPDKVAKSGLAFTSADGLFSKRARYQYERETRQYRNHKVLYEGQAVLAMLSSGPDEIIVFDKVFERSPVLQSAYDDLVKFLKKMLPKVTVIHHEETTPPEGLSVHMSVAPKKDTGMLDRSAPLVHDEATKRDPFVRFEYSSSFRLDNIDF